MLDVNKELETFFRLLDDLCEEEGLSEAVVEEAVSAPKGVATQAERLYSTASRPSAEISRSPRTIDRIPAPPAQRRSAVSFPRPVAVKRKRSIASMKPLRAISVSLLAVLLLTVLGFSFSSYPSQLGTLINRGWERVGGSKEPLDSRLSVASIPSGAKVSVDGNLIGISPFFDIRVATGRHDLRVEKSGFTTIDSSLLVQGRRSLLLRLVSPSQRRQEKRAVSRDESPRFEGGHEGAAQRVGPLAAAEVENNGEADPAPIDPTSPVDDWSDDFGGVDPEEADEFGDELQVADAGDEQIVADEVRSMPQVPVTMRPVGAVPSRVSNPNLRRAIVTASKSSQGGANFEGRLEAFDRAQRRGDALLASGKYEEAIKAYEVADGIIPGVPFIIEKVSQAQKAAEIKELPSAVFSSH